MFSILERLESSTKLLEVKEVAAIFDVHEKKVRKMAAKPAPAGWPCLRLESQIKFDPSALAHWVKSQSPAMAVARKAALKSAA